MNNYPFDVKLYQEMIPSMGEGVSKGTFTDSSRHCELLCVNSVALASQSVQEH